MVIDLFYDSTIKLIPIVILVLFVLSHYKLHIVYNRKEVPIGHLCDY